MPSMALSVLMCTAVMIFGTWLPGLPVLLKLTLQIGWGAALYIGLAAVFSRESFCYLKGLTAGRFAQGRGK